MTLTDRNLEIIPDWRAERYGICRSCMPSHMSLLNDGPARFGPFSASVVEVAVLSGERLLIVEEEFLIALDIQRVVEDANARKTVFARSFIELRALDDRLHEFDLAIVTPPRPGTSDWSIADRLVGAGPAVVVSSAAPVNTAGTSLADAEIVYKPFSDDELLAACRRALGKRAAR